MYFIYILSSFKTDRYYVGCTNNINQRLKKHNKGYVRSTKSYRPWKLVYQEEFNTLSVARKREKQIKSWKSRYNIEKLMGKN